MFWNDFIKLIGPSSAGYVILFSSYGSPGDNPLAFPTPTTIPHAAVTPIYIPEGQRISLQPRPWAGRGPIEGDDGLGLLLTYPEFNDVVNGWNTCGINFSPVLLEGIYSFTQGHVGILILLLNAFITQRDIRGKIKQHAQLTLIDLQSALFTTPVFHHTLRNDFAARSLPRISSTTPMSSLQDPAIAAVFRRLLASKSIREETDVGSGTHQVSHDALAVCFLNGWVHSDLEPATTDLGVARRVYILPSRCHEWYISCALLPPSAILSPFSTHPV